MKRALPVIIALLISVSAQASGRTQVLSQDEIHLGLPGWEAETLGIPKKKTNAKLVKATTELAQVLGISFWYAYAILAARSHTTSQNIVSFLIAPIGLYLGIEMAGTTYVTYHGAEDVLETISRVTLEHADRTCVEKGFKYADPTLTKAAQLKPISLHPQDFDKFKIFMDGVQISADQAEAYYRSFGQKNMIHQQFTSLFCE